MTVPDVVGNRSASKPFLRQRTTSASPMGGTGSALGPAGGHRDRQLHRVEVALGGSAPRRRHPRAHEPDAPTVLDELVVGRPDQARAAQAREEPVDVAPIERRQHVARQRADGEGVALGQGLGLQLVEEMQALGRKAATMPRDTARAPTATPHHHRHADRRPPRTPTH